MAETQTPLNMRKKLRLIYLLVIAFVLVITAVSLVYPGSHISNIVLAGIALISIITSLLPYFISMYVFKKYEDERDKSYKIVGIALYLCSYPFMIWVIYATIYEMLSGTNHWAFG